MTEANNWRHDQGTTARMLPDASKLEASHKLITDFIEKCSPKKK